VIVVTELAAGGGAGAIDTFVVPGNGKAKAVTGYPSSDGFPFGSAFDSNDTLLVTNLHTPAPGTIGSMSSYTVSNAGKVTPIDTKSTSGELPCWVAITGNDKFAFAVNTGAGAPATVARFKLLSTGSLNFRGLTPERPTEFARTDAAVSGNSRYLYVLSPQVNPQAGGGSPASHIDEYKVTATGGLVFIGKTPAGANLGVGATGLAAL